MNDREKSEKETISERTQSLDADGKDEEGQRLLAATEDQHYHQADETQLMQKHESAKHAPVEVTTHVQLFLSTSHV